LDRLRGRKRISGSIVSQVDLAECASGGPDGWSRGLTFTAAAAYYVVTGRLDTTAWSPWAANLLFAINQIQFVQLRIHAARTDNRGQKLAIGRGFLMGQALLVTLIFAVCATGIFRWYAAMAFLPVLIRGFAWFGAKPKPLAVHSLGKSELASPCLCIRSAGGDGDATPVT
jgi:hypothetical protein